MSLLVKKIQLKHIFILYLIILFDIICLKFFGDVGAMLTTIKGNYAARQAGLWNMNMIPFDDLYDTYRFYLREGNYMGASARVLFANIYLLMPLGFLLPFVRRNFNYFSVMGISLLIITGIEGFQFVSMLGIADLDDVIVNMVGCHIGYVLALTLQLIRVKLDWDIPLLPEVGLFGKKD